MPRHGNLPVRAGVDRAPPKLCAAAIVDEEVVDLWTDEEVATRPVRRRRWTRLIVVEVLTQNTRVAARADCPSATAPINRSHRS